MLVWLRAAGGALSPAADLADASAVRPRAAPRMASPRETRSSRMSKRGRYEGGRRRRRARARVWVRGFMRALHVGRRKDDESLAPGPTVAPGPAAPLHGTSYLSGLFAARSRR